MKFSKGFTLVELIVSIFIISLLSTAMLLNYRTGQEGAVLNRAAAFFETDLRRAQNLAVASSEFEGVIPCGYGLHFLDSRNYSLYVGRPSPSCTLSNRNFESGPDAIYQNIKVIEQSAVFKSSFSDIFFEPPDPATFINNNRSIGVSTAVEICLEVNLAKCRTLTIDTAGRIVIQ